MICTKSLVTRFEEVPVDWVWMYYCNLWDVAFDGSNFKVLSLFKREKNPSMSIYFKSGKYRFKCHTTGNSGDHIDLVKALYDVNFFGATRIIHEDYNSWILNSGGCNLKISDFKREKAYKAEFKTRVWNELDKKFWTEYYIGTRILGIFRVAPLSEFTLLSDENRFTVQGEYIYGYFNALGELCKIYQPKVSKRKFIYVRDYLQGNDQRKKTPHLLIQAGLKDIMSFYSLGLEIDSIAPHSENTMINSSWMNAFLKDYEQVLVMFDNDEAGKKMTEKYCSLYPIKPVYQLLHKDVADVLRFGGVRKSREYFVPLIDRVLCSEIVLDKKLVKEMPSLYASIE